MAACDSSSSFRATLSGDGYRTVWIRLNDGSGFAIHRKLVHASRLAQALSEDGDVTADQPFPCLLRCSKAVFKEALDRLSVWSVLVRLNTSFRAAKRVEDLPPVNCEAWAGAMSPGGSRIVPAVDEYIEDAIRAVKEWQQSDAAAEAAAKRVGPSSTASSSASSSTMAEEGEEDGVWIVWRWLAPEPIGDALEVGSELYEWLQLARVSKVDIPLYNAVDAGLESLVRLMLRLGAGSDESALQAAATLAVLQSKLDLFKLLWVGEGKCRPYLTDRVRQDAFRLAGDAWDVATCRALAEAGDAPALKHRNISSVALMDAIEKDDVELFRFALATGEDSAADDKLLLSFAGSGASAVCQMMLEAGADANATDAKSGDTVLHKAAAGGVTGLVEALLVAGADVNAVSKQGRTPLYAAAANGAAAVCEALLLAGADANAVTKGRGDTVLHLAAGKGHSAVCEALLRAGADANAVTKGRGDTALHLAAGKCHSAVCEALLEAGADLKAADAMGRTPFHLAVQTGSAQMCEALLAAGADVHSADASGKAALHYAATNANPGVCELLLEAGADATGVDNEGRTALHVAAKLGRASVCPVLVAAGADVAAAKKDGKTALHIASKQAHSRVVELLLEYGASPLVRDSHGRTALDVCKSTSVMSLLRKFGDG